MLYKKRQNHIWISTLNDKKFGKLADAQTLWDTIYSQLCRGIATQDTQDIFDLNLPVIDLISQSLQIKCLEDRTIFAKPGDSWWCYCVSVHYSIPLKLVLQDYCEKHCIDALNLTFENPKMTGTLRYDASRTAKQSNVEKFKPKLNIPYDETAFDLLL